MLDLDINSALLDTTGMLLLAMKGSDEERLLEEVLSKRGSIFPSHCVQEVVLTKIESTLVRQIPMHPICTCSGSTERLPHNRQEYTYLWPRGLVRMGIIVGVLALLGNIVSQRRLGGVGAALLLVFIAFIYPILSDASGIVDNWCRRLFGHGGGDECEY